MNTTFADFDGPRLLRREEAVASERLARICFGGPELDNEQEFFANYVPPQNGGFYGLSHRGQLISQIGIFHDQLKMYDGTIRTGSIGGVCTHPDYRNKGLASRLMEYCTAQLVQEGARLMLISGDAGVYIRLGNVFQGKYMYFSIKPGQGTQWRSTPADLVLRRATPADALICSQLYQAEPVHFVRTKSDFDRALHDPMQHTYIHVDQWIIERAGQIVAYLFLGVPWHLTNQLNLGIRHVGEYAGSHSALVDALQALIATGAIQDLTWPVAWQDKELIQLLQDSGYGGNITHLDGSTLRIIDFPNFMKDLRPILRAHVDATLLRGLHFEQSGPLLGGTGVDRYMIIRGRDRLELDGASMTQLVMGSPDLQKINAPGALAEVVSALFPLPSFLPGLNYH
jgi:GNAT superfamily N-acetyltransferase